MINNEKGLTFVKLDSNAENPYNPEPKAADISQEKENKDIADHVGRLLYGKFTVWRDEREEIEWTWMRALRAYLRRYDEDSKEDVGGTEVFVGLTRAKTMAAYARIVELLLGPDRPWSIEPSPVPEFKDGMTYVDPITQAPDFVEGKKLRSVIKENTDKMEKTIEDQLLHADFPGKFKLAIMELCLLGNGCIKGATINVRDKPKWIKLEDNTFEYTSERVVEPGIDAPSVWDLFPDPWAKTPNDMSGIFEQHIIGRDKLIELSQLKGFDKSAIDEILDYIPDGDYEPWKTEIERRYLYGFRRTIEGHNGRYLVLEYWGNMRGADLKLSGMKLDEEEVKKDYQVNVWFCANRTIRMVVNPMTPQRIPYNIVPYEKIPGQFWAIGIPLIMEDSQRVINSAYVALLNNMAISKEPQYEINLDLLAPGETTDVIPGKKWRREGGDPTTPLLRFYTPPIIGDPLLKIVDVAKRFADEETSMPSYTYGVTSPGLNKTATGMGMLMNASNVVLKSVIKNIDDFLFRPMIQSYYDFNMKWSEDEDIKHSDVEVHVRGATTIIGKDLQVQKQMQFAQLTGNPVDMQYVDRAELVKNIANNLGLSEEVIIQQLGEMQQQQDGIPQQPGQQPLSQDNQAAGNAYQPTAPSPDTSGANTVDNDQLIQ